jgi:hypothetical protein
MVGNFTFAWRPAVKINRIPRKNTFAHFILIVNVLQI